MRSSDTVNTTHCNFHLANSHNVVCLIGEQSSNTRKGFPSILLYQFCSWNLNNSRYSLMWS